MQPALPSRCFTWLYLAAAALLYRFLYLPSLNKAVGSRFLRHRVEEALRPDMHLFGHTHFGWDATLGGIRYVQAALAYPEERKKRMPSLEIGGAEESIRKVVATLFRPYSSNHFFTGRRQSWSGRTAASWRNRAVSGATTTATTHGPRRTRSWRRGWWSTGATRAADLGT